MRPELRVLILLRGSTAPSGTGVLVRRNLSFLPLLEERGVELTVMTVGARGGVHERLEGLCTHTGTLGADRWFAFPRAMIRLARVLRRQRFDLIQAQEPIPAIVAGIARRLGRVDSPVVYFRHHATGSWKLKWASRLAARLCTQTHVFSAAAAAHAIEDDRTDPSAVSVIRCGVPEMREVSDEEVAAVRSQLGIAAGDVVVGSVSRLRAEKGLDDLIFACSHLMDDRKDLHLVLAGDGPDEERLRSLAGELLPGRVHFVGHQDDVALWFRVLDVACMPSRREAFGRAAVEAMAMARPVVASSVGGLREIVRHGETGLLVPMGDIPALVAVLKELLDDDARRLEMGKLGSEIYLSNYTLADMADGYVGAWREVLVS